MRRHYYLGLAARRKGAWRQLFTHGSSKDLVKLEQYLSGKYNGETMLCKNGRSALALALEAYFNKGDAVIVSGFTCYAVIEAIKAAGLTPVYADISKEDLNFNVKTLEQVFQMNSNNDSPTKVSQEKNPSGSTTTSTIRTNPVGIIIQNTLGNPVNMEAVEKFARKHGLLIIEDLAHCAGVKYPDGREAGTVGSATVLSFGKDKSIDTISGGAVIFRSPKTHIIKAPSGVPKLSDYLRSRWYPMFGAICRGLSYVHLGGVLMRGLVAIHWVEKSADNRLDLTRRLTKFEAKLALEQIKQLKRQGEPPLRDFFLVNERTIVLEKLRKAGYYFDGFWYEKPVSPIRYYRKVHFPEDECPVAVEVSKKIINFPTYYKKNELINARKIVEEYLDE